jgi:PAS domain S-box-containing protein
MTIELRDAGRELDGSEVFRLVFMTMDEGAMLFNAHGEIVTVNPAAEHILGVTAAELTGRSFARCVQDFCHLHEDGTPYAEEECPAMLASRSGKAQRNVVMGLRRPDCTLVWLSVNVQPLVRDGDAGPYAVVKTFRDTTEHRRTRGFERFRSRILELLAGGADLEMLLDSIVRGVEKISPDSICSVLLVDGEGKRLGSTTAPNLPDFYNAAIDGIEIGLGVGSCGTAAASGQRVIVDDIQRHPYWVPYRELAARAGLGSCWSEPILDSSGRVLGTFAIYHHTAQTPAASDIALIEKSAHLASIAIERKRSEDALRASEREFRTLADNLPDILVRYDRAGRRTYVSPTLNRLALASEQLLGKTVQENNPTGMHKPEMYWQALQHTLTTGERSEFEVQFTLADGRLVTHLCFIAAERDAEGRITGAVSVGRDITELKRNEAELEGHRHHLERLIEERTLALSLAKEAAETATRAKTHFLAAASHDMRQPLQAIGLFNDALAMTELDAQQQRISRSLSKAVESLSDLLNELLDISRLDAGTIEPKPAVIHALDLLGTIGAEFDALSREKGLSLNLYCPRQDLALFSDEHLLLTILRNLVTNAMKYTERGGVLVSIRRRAGQALIQVWDTGIGIAPEQMDSIFEEYFQVGNPERDRSKGVGLGLSIVRRLGALLGIEVSCRSRLGQGSVFELVVPLADGAAALGRAKRGAVGPETAAERLAGKRIVIIEDDAIAAEAIKLTLEMGGAQVVQFRTAESALASAELLGADFYLSDYRLPGMDGVRLLDAIQRASAQSIKAVILTGNTSPEQIRKLQASGWKILFKPVDLPGLLAVMAEADRESENGRQQDSCAV